MRDAARYGVESRSAGRRLQSSPRVKVRPKQLPGDVGQGGGQPAVATKTISRPVRSGASRTASMTKPLAVNDASTSARSRNLSVEFEVSSAPSAWNRKFAWKDTNGKATSVRSVQVSTSPTSRAKRGADRPKRRVPVVVGDEHLGDVAGHGDEVSR